MSDSNDNTHPDNRDAGLYPAVSVEAASPVDPYEVHPEHPRPVTNQVKDINTFTREEVTQAISKLIKQVKKARTPTWGFSRTQLIKHIKNIIPNIEKARRNKDERESTKREPQCYGEFEV